MEEETGKKAELHICNVAGSYDRCTTCAHAKGHIPSKHCAGYGGQAICHREKKAFCKKI